MQRSRDQFVRVATAGVMAWILLQAIINIGAVIGLLPVIGVPLPLVSAGGSALVTTMLALGMLLSFARNEPGARAILAARPGVVRRSLAVLPVDCRVDCRVDCPVDGRVDCRVAGSADAAHRALVGAVGRGRLGRSRLATARPRGRAAAS